MIRVEWKGKRVFEATPPTGNRFLMDAYPEVGGQDMGPTPMEAFLAAGAACSGIDVMQILEKKRQNVTSYRVEVEGKQKEGETYPKPYVNIVFRHIIEGENLDPIAVEQAVKLSDEKYCTAIATLRSGPAVSSVFEVRQSGLLDGVGEALTAKT